MKFLVKFLFLCLTSFQTLIAQKKDSNSITKIPLNIFEKEYILMDLSIGKDTLTFYFDTGAGSTLLDSQKAKDLGIVADIEQSVQGAGGSNTYKVATNQKLSIQNIELSDVNLIFEDLFRLNEALGISFDGIIGYSLLTNYITKIDYENEEIVLYDDISKLDLSNFTKHKFVFENGLPIPQFDIEIVLNNGERLKGPILFDSGAGLTLLINTPFKNENKILEKSKFIHNTETNNLSKSSNTEQIIINQLIIGDYEFNNLQIGLASDVNGVSGMDGYLGILGAEIINNFTVILDYSKNLIYLKLNNDLNSND